MMEVEESPPELTTREHEAAALAAAGMSNKQIAKTLSLSEGTVKQRLHCVFIKLGIRRREQLILQKERLLHS